MGENKTMTDRKIFITENDMWRLNRSFQITTALVGRNRQHFENLQEKLDRAEIVEPKKIPEGVITMNSQIRLRNLDTGEEMTYWLVFPDKTNVSPNALSVLAPMGTALLGYKEGDMIELDVPGGTKKLLVLEVIYQPERLGNYEL